MLRRLWLGYSSTSHPSTHLLSAVRGWCGEGLFRAEPSRQRQGSSVVFREGREAEVYLRKGHTVHENQHRGEEQGGEGGSNISVIRLAMLMATSKGLPSRHLLSQAGLSPNHKGKPDPLLVKSNPFGHPLSSLRSLSK